MSSFSAPSMLPATQCAIMDRIAVGCGWSQTRNTLVSLIKPKPLCVACKLLSALRMSPSAVKMSAASPSSLYPTCSAWHTWSSRSSTISSLSRVKRRIAQRLWIGSMILVELLHASAKRVVAEKISMVRRSACWAAAVMLSASSRMTILWRPGGSVTFCCANILILLRTVSMPRSSEALSSSTACLKAGPRSSRARHRILVVLPVPGGPAIMRFVMLPSRAIARRQSMVSALPTTSCSVCGRYFSTHGASNVSAIGVAGFFTSDCEWAAALPALSDVGILTNQSVL